jgi:signal transduction histidine kinase
MLIKKLIHYWQSLSYAGAGDLPENSSKRVVLANRICIILALTSIFFTVPWALQLNTFMVSINILLACVYGLVIWLNHKKLYDIPKFFIILCVSTPVFIVSGMLGQAKSNLHFSLIPIAGFSILLFDRKEKFKIILAIAYPMVLLSILIASNFKLFPNLVGDQIEMLPTYDYFLNFAIIFSTMFCFYQAYINTEDKYQILYEEHLKAQKQLDEERAKAIYATKMVALGEMAGGIAHEINGPLFIIRSLSDKLCNHLPTGKITPEKVINHVRLIHQTSSKISGIIKSLSSISRSSHDDPLENVILSSLIQETLVICHHRYYLKGIAIEVSCPEDLPQVKCRSVEIGQILINLLNNAYDSVEDILSPKVTILAYQEREEVLLIVEDNGPGIPAEIKEKIFDTFYTTKPVGKGTGLGLSISKKLMEANHGKLSFDSIPGSTRFTLQIPIAT